MIEVQVLCGPIASGKSTYSLQKAREGFVIINDAIVTAVHGGDYGLYSDELKPLYKSIENHILATAVALGKSVIVDRGLNCDRAARRRWVGLARSLDAVPVAVQFENQGPEVHARRRTDSDSRGANYTYWLTAAKAHQFRATTPSLNEGFTEVRQVQFDPAIKSN